MNIFVKVGNPRPEKSDTTMILLINAILLQNSQTIFSFPPGSENVSPGTACLSYPVVDRLFLEPQPKGW